MTELGIELNDTSTELGIELDNLGADYNGLNNLPQINGITLQGNKTGSQLGLAQADEVYTKTQTDTMLNLKADKSTTYTKSEADTLLNAKADKSTTYNKTETDTLLNAKQNTINDLASIRQGASKGATSVQPSAISDMATKTWTNAQGFLKEHQSLANYYNKSETDAQISNHHDSSKQDTLVSGTNIKTINNQSLLGSGNIDTQGGGGGDDVVNSAFPIMASIYKSLITDANDLIFVNDNCILYI